MRLPVLLFLAAASVGCTTMRGRADAAYARGSYVEAADLYDELAHRDPDDAEVKARRADARNATLRAMLAEAQSERRAGKDADAAASLGKLLDRREAWGWTIEPAYAPQLAAEVSATSAWIEAEIAKKSGPLGAEQLLASHEHLLSHPDFGGKKADLRARITEAGRGSCARLAEAEGTPYAGWVAARFCTHFGAPANAPVLPNLRAGLAVDGAAEGLNDTESSHVRAALAAAFARSVWFSPAGPSVAHGVFGGRLATAFTAQRVDLKKNWIEQVAYTEYETTQESYQEPYEDTETHEERVPYTDYETRTYPCGDRTCSDMQPVTRYRMETRTRRVTRYRTAWRDVTRPVTRYRDEPRVFEYQAIERSGRYASHLRVRVDRDVPAIDASIDGDFARHGFDHDVTFAPAGIAPSRAGLVTREAFVGIEEERLAAAFVAALDEEYRGLYCARATYTFEDAAACAYLDPVKAPPAAHAALRAVFADDEPLLAPILAR